MKTTLLATILFTAMLAAPCLAQSQFSIRLVEARQSGGADPQDGVGLEDVIDMLKRHLVSARYRFVDSCTVKLPADDTLTLGEYTVKCSGNRKNLSVTVLRFGKQVLKTASVQLKDKKPFIIGGLPGKTGLMLLVFMGAD
ncbi:MAG: hypothetical protein WCL44_01310 [bacterium]